MYLEEEGRHQRGASGHNTIFVSNEKFVKMRILKCSMFCNQTCKNKFGAKIMSP